MGLRSPALLLALLLQAPCCALLLNEGRDSSYHGRFDATGTRRRGLQGDATRPERKVSRKDGEEGRQGHSSVFLRDSVARVVRDLRSEGERGNVSSHPRPSLHEDYGEALRTVRNRTSSLLDDFDPRILRYAGIEKEEDMENFLKDPIWKRNFSQELEKAGSTRPSKSKGMAMRSEADAWIQEPEQNFHTKVQYSARAANLGESIMVGKKVGTNTTALETEAWLLSQTIPWLKAQLGLRNISYAQALDKSDLVSLLVPFSSELRPTPKDEEEIPRSKDSAFPSNRFQGLGRDPEQDDSYSSQEVQRYGIDPSLKKKRNPKNASNAAPRAPSQSFDQNNGIYTKLRFADHPSVILPSKKPWKYAEFLDSARLAGKIKVHADDRFGSKTSVYVKPKDTIKDLKALIGHKIGKDPRALILEKCRQVYDDEATLSDCEVHDGMNFELSYNKAYLPYGPGTGHLD